MQNCGFWYQLFIWCTCKIRLDGPNTFSLFVGRGWLSLSSYPASWESSRTFWPVWNTARWNTRHYIPLTLYFGPCILKTTLALHVAHLQYRRPFLFGKEIRYCRPFELLVYCEDATMLFIATSSAGPSSLWRWRVGAKITLDLQRPFTWS